MSTIYFRPSKCASFSINVETLEVRNVHYTARLSDRQFDTIKKLHATDADYTELSNMVYGYLKILDLDWEML